MQEGTCAAVKTELQDEPESAILNKVRVAGSFLYKMENGCSVGIDDFK